MTAEVETLFCHGVDDGYLVVVRRDGERLFRARLELGETDAGPRPRRFAVKTGSSEEPRQPDEFVELARRAERIRISEQTPRAMRRALTAMLEGYQLEATAVRTCRICAEAGRYGPITAETAVSHGDDDICLSCAERELERELTYVGSVGAGASERLRELLEEVRDLERIVNLLSGQLDPELTRFDTISATTEAVEPVPVEDLDVHPRLAELLAERFETLLPVQSLAVREGLLAGDDQLVVSATATGKTLIGEIAGIDRVLRGEGTLLFLVPLVALANQTYGDFKRDYGDLVDVTLRVGASRIGSGGVSFDPSADVVVGTYEGIDHALRTGRDLGDIGTVVIDEVHALAEAGRGHRLDGLIARLAHHCEQRATRRTGYDGAQWIYLSATVGNPGELGDALGATVVEFEDRPIPIERHVTFVDGTDKTDVIDRLVTRAFDGTSSKGYRGQTIVFTNARRRCHEIARRLEYDAAPYHAGLDHGQRRSVEERFADQELAAVVTTAALAAGVDFPASQVVFDSLAMGIEWLSVQEFEQMLGRAGRPDYHDEGVVYVLVEPDGRYHRGMDRSEDEVAFELLRGEMDDVTPVYGDDVAVEETLANVVVSGQQAKAVNRRMVGTVDTTRAVALLLEYGFIDGLEPTPLGRVVTEHFLSPGAAFSLLEGIRGGKHPHDLVARLELAEE